MAQTDFEKDAVLDDATHIGLFSAAPSDTGGGTELSGSGYARQAVTWSLSGDTGTNAADITFTNSGSDWDTATHIGLFDASSAGHLLHWVEIDEFTLRAGRTYTIAAGDLEATFS